jgi:hypothetical protein
MLKDKKNIIFVIALTVNALLVLVPTYDTVNYSFWIRSILTIHNNLPAFYYSINPGGFFTAIFLVPMSVVYSFTSSFYYTAVATKSIILLFFLMSVYLFSSIMESYVDDKNSARFITLLYILSPGILFVNFIWSEVDIISVFFVTLSVYFLRIRPIRRDNINEAFFGLSIFISILFFLYPVILLPSFIYFTRGARKRVSLIITLILGGIIFAALDLLLFQGHLYNYVSSLSGTSTDLSPGALKSGLFYNFQFFGLQKESIEIVLVLFLAIVIPYILKQLNLSEFKVEFIIIAVFLFVSPVLNRDNFLFVLPFLFLATIEPLGKVMSKKKTVAMSLFLLLPLFSAISGSVNNAYGIFYWFYPLLHDSGPLIISKIQQTITVPAYNLYFILILFISITIILYGDRRELVSPVRNTIHKGVGKKAFKIIMITIAIVILIIAPISIIYNDSNNNISIENPGEFPLLYFYPENNLNSTISVPVGSDSYSLHGDNLEIPSSMHDLILEDSLLNESYNISGKYAMSHTSGLANLSYTQIMGGSNWKLSDISMMSNISFSTVDNLNLSVNTIGKTFVPYIGNQSVFNPGMTNSLTYRVQSSSLDNNTYAIFFMQPKNLTREEVPVCISSNNNVLYVSSMNCQYSITGHVLNTSYYRNTSSIYSENSLGRWNYVLINEKQGAMSITMDGISQAELFKNSKYITISVGSSLYNKSRIYDGVETQLLLSNRSRISFEQRLEMCNFSKWKSLGNINYYKSFNFRIVTENGNGKMMINSSIFKLNNSSFIYMGKLGGTESITISISHLSVHYDGSTGYYLIPLFLAFSLPVFFGLLSTIYIMMSDSNVLTLKKEKN